MAHLTHSSWHLRAVLKHLCSKTCKKKHSNKLEMWMIKTSSSEMQRTHLHLRSRRILSSYRASSDKSPCVAAVRIVGKQGKHLRWIGTEGGFLGNIWCFSFVRAQHDCPVVLLDHGRF